METLRGHGYRLTLAFDGVQGYARALSVVPDLILLDVCIPGMSGFALTRMLKANPATEHIPILFLSSSAEAEDRLTGLRAGAADYITKPFQPAEVLERVRIHLALARRGSRGGEDGRGERKDGAQVMHGDRIIVRAARRIIWGQLHDPPDSAAIARMVGVSERRLASAFEQCLNRTLFQFVRDARMRKARHLLVHTSLSILSIAQELGYSSAANFSTAFRQHVGVSPSRFRKDSLLKR